MKHGDGQSGANKFRVGFIIDGDRVNAYVHDVIKQVDADKTLFATPLLFSQQLPASDTRNWFLRATRLIFQKGPAEIGRILLVKLIEAIEVPKVRRIRIHSSFRQNVSVDADRYPIVKVTPEISKSGVVFTYKSNQLQKFKNHECDVLIRCGSGILKGEILNLTKFGVLSFHHADNYKYRGIPVGFWEVFEKDPSSGFVIQRLVEELDGGDVIFRGNIATTRLWMHNEAQLLRKSNIFLFKILKEIAATRELPDAEAKIPYSGPLRKRPNMVCLISYLCRLYSKAIFDKIIESRHYTFRWSVSYLSKGGLDLPLFRGNTIKNRSGTFLADPFVIQQGGSVFCLAEEFFYAEGKGKISAYKLFDSGYKYLGVVLEEEFHLSFPFLIRHNGSIYMIPETFESEQIRLYRAEEFPYRWKLEAVLIDNVRAVDSVVIQNDGMWFLLTNMCSAEIDDFNSELHIYYSNDLFSGNWTPFRKNPVILDSKKARNGGLFSIGDKTYRVNQVQGLNHYGKSFDINEIQKISIDEYREREIAKVTPDFFAGLKSTHHFHTCDGYTVFDHNSLEKVQ